MSNVNKNNKIQQGFWQEFSNKVKCEFATYNDNHIFH